MPQEIRVVKCYKCGVFQADIVKKTNKWSCKLCGEKQSVKQEFGRGSGKDCRLQSQELNYKKNNDDVAEANTILNMLVDGNAVFPKKQNDITPLNLPSRQPQISQQNNQSKWDQYLEDNKNNVNDNDTGTDLLPNNCADEVLINTDPSKIADGKRSFKDNDENTIVSKKPKRANTQQNLLNIDLRKKKAKVIFNDSAIFSEKVDKKLTKSNFTIVKRKSLDTQRNLLNFDLAKDDIKVIFNDAEKLNERKAQQLNYKHKINRDEIKVIYNNSKKFKETPEEPAENKCPRYKAQQKANLISNKPKTNSKWSKFIPNDSD